MADELLPLYERELTFLRQHAAEFASKHPKIAGRLHLEPDKCEDPHVERLIEAFAFLTARIQHKVEDELPEVTDALLNVLYPHYLAPVPSMAVAEFVVDPAQGQTSAQRIERGATVFSPPVAGSPCRFRVAYPVTLWPMQVTGAHAESSNAVGPVPGAVSVIRVRLQCFPGVTLKQLPLDRVRFFLHGEPQVVFPLYELLFNELVTLRVRPLDPKKSAAAITLPPSAIQPVGFGPDEGVLPYSQRSFLGYRLLQEYFYFPDKFLFLDVAELQRAKAAGFEDGFELLFYLRQAPSAPQAITDATFRLGCAPVVNLYSQPAEPIRLNHTETEYRVVPDVRRPDATEVYAIDGVVSTSPQLEGPIVFEPFYSIRHSAHQRGPRAFWYASRRPSARKGDPGTEVYLSLVDLDFRPALPAVETLTVHVTCSNRDLPAKLPFGGGRSDFELEGAVPLSRIRCLTKPTATVRPPTQRGAQWRLISHMALNYLSICEGGREALQEILSLYDVTDSPVIRQHIAGIANVSARRVVARPPSFPWNGFCRGMEVTLEFDEDKYAGTGVFLFASVLERFLALYGSLNSFTQLVATTRQRPDPVKRWPPRAGEQILL
jgi:type VI secretion system protein ImpG